MVVKIVSICDYLIELNNDKIMFIFYELSFI
jgi:hypothetical protein